MGTFIVALFLLGVVAAIVGSLVRNKKRGKSSCGCSACSGCAMNGKCRR